MDASWVSVVILSITSAVGWGYTVFHNGKSNAKWQGKVGQQIASLKEDFVGVEKTLRNNMSGACPVGKRVDRLEKQMDHLSDK